MAVFLSMLLLIFRFSVIYFNVDHSIFKSALDFCTFKIRQYGSFYFLRKISFGGWLEYKEKYFSANVIHYTYALWRLNPNPHGWVIKRSIFRRKISAWCLQQIIYKKKSKMPRKISLNKLFWLKGFYIKAFISMGFWW
jgi:hypothetical protein